jgi:hypothetical protein
MGSNSVREDVIEIFDSIIPGIFGKWHAFSKVILLESRDIENISGDNIEIIETVRKYKQDGAGIGHALTKAEAGDPKAFARLYRALCDAYYASPSVLDRVAELSEAGPHEPSPHFDTSLLDKVIATQAGKGRF